MTKIIIDAKTHADIARDLEILLFWGWLDDDCDDDPEDFVAMTMCEMTNELTKFHRAYGFWYDRETKNLMCDTNYLPLIIEINNVFHDDYDSLGVNEDPPRFDCWAIFKLSGDDDVDYNSGYPSAAIDIVIEYCKRNAINVRTYK